MKYLYFILLFILFMGCNEKDGQYLKALELLQNNDYNEAFLIAEGLVVKYENDISVLKLMGDCLFAKESYDLAIEYYNKVLEAEVDTSALFLRSRAYFKVSLLEGALNDLNKLIRIDTTKVDYYLERGKVFEALGTYEEAISDYQKVLYLDPQNYIALNNKGVSHESIGEYSQAIECYNKILERDNFDSRIFYNRAVAKAQNGDLEGAVEDFSVAIKLNQHEGTYYYNRGIVYEMMNELEKASADWKEAARLGNEDARESLRPIKKNGGDIGI